MAEEPSDKTASGTGETDKEREDRLWEESWQRRFWRRFAWASLGVFTVLSLLLIIPAIFWERGPLARNDAERVERAQIADARAEELRTTASAQRTRSVGQGVEAATLLASLLGPAVEAAGSESQALRQEGQTLIGELLREVGLPLTNDGARAIGRAILSRYSNDDARPPSTIGGQRRSSTINLTITIRDRQPPRVITKVIRLPDNE